MSNNKTAKTTKNLITTCASIIFFTTSFLIVENQCVEAGGHNHQHKHNTTQDRESKNSTRQQPRVVARKTANVEIERPQFSPNRNQTKTNTSVFNKYDETIKNAARQKKETKQWELDEIDNNITTALQYIATGGTLYGFGTLIEEASQDETNYALVRRGAGYVAPATKGAGLVIAAKGGAQLVYYMGKKVLVNNRK